MANIKVAVRVRPISNREINVTGAEIVVHTEPQKISLTNLKVSSSKTADSRTRIKRYSFDYCFDSSDPTADNYASQEKIYDTLGNSVIDALFIGYNSCVVAYGQSASGKTFTMMGVKDDPGLIPRICSGLFTRAAEEIENGRKLHIFVSYLEVYNERVRDLLEPSTSPNNLRVREHPRSGPYVQGLSQHSVETLSSLMSRVEEGTKARKTASTLQNHTSSRSHALLTLSLESSDSAVSGQVILKASGASRKTDFSRGCKLHLVDLAGSENSAACAGINRLKSQEGANINKSLVALGNVISALAERSSASINSGRKFIPYRDSTLTWLLKDSLGGNATTIMLATISPASGSYNETSHTLRFAQRAQSVINKPVINEDPVTKIIRELQSEVSRLKALLAEKNDPLTDCKSLCICQRNPDQTVEQTNLNTRCVSTSTSQSPIELNSLSKFPYSLRRYSFDDGLRLRCDSLNALRQFGSLEFVPATNNSQTLQVSASYNRAKVSELIDDDDQADEPVFVDIPTLVAVLIKPDTSVQVDTHQIEEISSDSVLEDTVDTEFNQDVEHHFANLVEDRVESNSTDSVKSLSVFKEITDNSNKQPSSLDTRYPNLKILTEKPLKNNKLQKQYSVDSNFDSQASSVSKILQKYISNVSRKVPKDYDFPRILSTDSEAQANSQEEKSEELLHASEDDDLKENKNLEKNPDSRGNEKSTKELHNPKACIQRKQSIDGLKRKTSKDSSCSSLKDEQLFITGTSKDSLKRKNSLDPEELQPRPHTIIQRARRAEIVAAVTERLYASKKTPEDSNTASTPASDNRSPENSEIKLASVTRMRLQEISRKMLAKRRRICVDTQTDISSTVRVREIGILVKEPKIIRKDVAVLTDRHEDFDKLLPCSTPVLRIKEMSTSTTESPPPKPIILFKDACNLTDDYNYDYDAIYSHHPDSGIVSDDTHTYAESNLSSTGISDFCSDIEKRPVDSVKMNDSSVNTNVVEEIVDTCAQTTPEDLHHQQTLNNKCCTSKQCNDNIIKQVNRKKNQDCCQPILVNPRLCKQPVVLNEHCHIAEEALSKTHKCAQESSSCNGDNHEKNIISISVPDTINITIESSNISESKLRLFDNNKELKVKNAEVQTDKRDINEIGTLTDINISGIHVKDSWTSSRSNSHADTKTFRIENIFQDPHDTVAKSLKVKSYSDEAHCSIVYPEKTSFAETNKEDDAYHNCKTSLSSLESRRKSLTSEWLRNRNTWSTQKYNCNLDPQTNAEPVSLPPEINCNSKFTGQLKNIPEVLSWKDLHNSQSKNDDTKKLNRSQSIVKDHKTSNSITLKSLEIDGNIRYPTKIRHNYRDIYEQDINFSDDSLDFKEKQRNSISNEIKASELNREMKDNFNDNACPPDIVVHAKKDTIDPLTFSDNIILDDFDDKYIELPKKIGIRFNEIPTQEIKSIFYHVPLIPIVFSQNEMENLQNKSNADNFEAATALPKPIMKNNKNISKTARSVRINANEYRSDSDCKKVSFVMSENFSNMSDTERENARGIKNGKRNLFEEYLEEAIVFMRNINLINSDEKSDSTLLSNRGSNNFKYDETCDSKHKKVIHHTNDDFDLKPDCCEEKRSNNLENFGQFSKPDKSAETKSHLAKFSSDNVNSSSSSCSRLRSFSSVDDLHWDHKLKNNAYSRSDCYNSKFSRVIDDDKYFYQLPNPGTNKVHTNIDNATEINSSDLKNYSNHGRIRNNNAPKVKKRSRSEFSVRPKTDCSFNKKVVTFDENNLHLHKKLTNNESSLIAKGRKSLAHPRCSISKYDSANENSSSNEALSNFMESIDEASRFKDKIRFPCSPRLKFLQLLSERRKIVEDTRNTSIS
ncbi:uncharacterized protein LOC103573205 isoform X1 [Microplitis demolitor]|uniref:uncharacterized protein LOC103573205 isoform X1 n=1 Tax=Microplitis demolitor TaxID=69319 RepID=UPI0004CD0ED9|nr:uncharacterized protein LOC103573205 isoform X1 [Microplitis demolitor]